MVRSAAWGRFRSGLKEIYGLLNVAAASQAGVRRGAAYTLDESIRRAALVLLTAHAEAYVAGVTLEITDGFPQSWNEMSDGGKHFAAAYVHRDVTTLVRSIALGDLRDEAPRSRLIGGLREAVRRVDEPNALPWTEPVRGFYTSNSFSAIDRRLQRFHPNGLSLQQWIHDRDHDVSRVRAVLDQLIETRNRVAHGIGFASPTPVDLRLYVGTVAWFVRDVDAYLTPLLPGHL